MLAAVQLTLGLWVVLAQPRRALNWAVGTLLILWAGSGIMLQLMREAWPTDAAAAAFHAKVGTVYLAPTFALILVIVYCTLLPTPKPARWRWLMVAAWAALPVLWFYYGSTPFSMAGEFLLAVNIFVEEFAYICAIWLAARTAGDPRAPMWQRRQAGLIGLAFGVLVAYA